MSRGISLVEMNSNQFLLIYSFAAGVLKEAGRNMVLAFMLTGTSEEFRFPVVVLWAIMFLVVSTLLNPTGLSTLCSCMAMSRLMGLDAPVTYHKELKSPINFQLSKIKCQGKSNISGYHQWGMVIIVLVSFRQPDIKLDRFEKINSVRLSCEHVCGRFPWLIIDVGRSTSLWLVLSVEWWSGLV